MIAQQILGRLAGYCPAVSKDWDKKPVPHLSGSSAPFFLAGRLAS